MLRQYLPSELTCVLRSEKDPFTLARDENCRCLKLMSKGGSLLPRACVVTSAQSYQLTPIALCSSPENEMAFIYSVNIYYVPTMPAISSSEATLLAGQRTPGTGGSQPLHDPLFCSGKPTSLKVPFFRREMQAITGCGIKLTRRDASFGGMQDLQKHPRWQMFCRMERES